MVRVHKLSLIGIVEAKLHLENVDQAVKRSFPAHWSVLHNAVQGSVARMVLAWDPQIFQVDLIFSSPQIIVVKILTVDQRLFYVSCIYGHNSMVDRRRLWEDMRRGGQGNVKSKLDRALINGSWLDIFPESETVFLAPGISDHCFILVNVLPDTPRRSPFKFFNFWMRHDQFKEELRKSWSLPVTGSTKFKLYEQLSRLKPVLREFNKKFFSQISERVVKAREELLHVQEQCFQNPYDAALVHLEKDLHLKFIDLSLAEESFKKQKSLVQWLALGDQNTRFFHLKVKSHCLRNKVLSLTNVEGIRLTDPKAVQDEILGYYTSLLGSPFLHSKEAYSVLRLAVPQRLLVSQKLTLSSRVSGDEIKQAMWSIEGDKSPGPDGYSFAFFQSNWDVVGSDVIQAIQLFFETGFLPRQWNCTALTLVPKVPSPNSIKDYRPIACCNVVYKCVTKVLANRLQQFLPSIVSSCQSAFIKGRSIMDNILLMQEIVKNYHKDGGKPRCAIKMDLMKAYDSVHWDFVLDMMRVLDFPAQFISWVQVCITSPMFSVVINGELKGFFPGQRGLRQGDPLSPYLFLLVMEGFTALLQYKIDQSSGFIYHPKCKPLNITHLIFADDLFVLCGAGEISFQVIADTLSDFYHFSGLQPNMQKSSIFFADTSIESKEGFDSYPSYSRGLSSSQIFGSAIIIYEATSCGLCPAEGKNSWSNPVMVQQNSYLWWQVTTYQFCPFQYSNLLVFYFYSPPESIA
ncbi:hypothetical protein RHGRI_000728 [Rhododendron griersonianum]|uniref:Reverse transcriptase domain-containing protein n=1 Tax=Rhododendron griersonianum TaxID=479676 RepID=A0AAV6LIQ3_9ERIC|nr:hypothetical protein RHGRI_000728 [Rhododendron griersonianum]